MSDEASERSERDVSDDGTGASASATAESNGHTIASRLSQTIDLAKDSADEDVDLTRSSPADQSVTTVPYNPQKVRDLSAQRIALGLVIIFGGFVLFMAIAILVVLSVSSDPQEAVEFGKAVDGVLTASSNFATAVFAPLLAFVLGYYFGEHSKQK